MARTFSCQLRRLLAGTMLAALFTSAAMADLSRLNALVSHGEFNQAYQHGQSLLADMVGNPQFDYLLGKAAYHSGHTGEAIFALQRVLMSQPAHNDARLLLGKAYYQDGQLASAYATLSRLIESNPGPSITRQAQQTLDRINAGHGKPEAKPFSAYLEYGTGSDSNVNAATDDEIIISSSSIILVTPGSIETDDDYSRVTVGINGRLPIGSGTSWLLGIRQYENSNDDNPVFDTRYTKFHTGIAVSSAYGEFIVPVQRRTLRVGADDFLHYNAVSMGWQKQFADLGYLGLLIESGSNHYLLTPERDSDIFTTLLHWSYPFKGGSLGLAVFGGSDNTDDSAYDYWSRSFTGIQARLSVSLLESHRQYIATKYLSSAYADIFPTFSEKRDESLTLTTIGWDWEFMPYVSLRLSGELSNNNSNIPLFDYKRKRSQLAIRFQY